MNRPKTVDAVNRVSVGVTYPLIHRCPFVDELDEGTVLIEWDCLGSTFELHSLADWLITWTGVEISHERLTSEIRHSLASYPGLTVTRVVTRWTTAGAEVEVGAS